MKLQLITIARSSKVVEPNKLTLPIQMFNHPENVLKIGVIKWEVSYYAEVLSNPRLENINLVFGSYSQFKEITNHSGGMAKVKIFLVANTNEVPIMPTMFTPVCNLIFDRALNQKPLSWGLYSGLVLEFAKVPSQMSL